MDLFVDNVIIYLDRLKKLVPPPKNPVKLIQSHIEDKTHINSIPVLNAYKK